MQTITGMKKIMNIVILLYLLAVLLVYPLYLENGYYSVAFVKWRFFLYSSLLFLAVMGVYVITVVVRSRGNALKKAFKSGELPDKAMGLYLLLSIITFLTCQNPQAAWMGTDGWYMGFVAQFLFGVLYLVFSVKPPTVKVVVIFHCLGAVCTFAIAVLQRYGLDILHLYVGMPDEVVRDYLSTLGNRSWFSGYACTVFPLGMYFFWRAQDKRKIFLAGTFTFLAFCCLAVMNSDSIYAALIAVFFVLFVLSIDSFELLTRFCALLEGWLGACLLMSLLRLLFSDSVKILRGFSGIFLDVRIALFCTVMSALLVVGCIQLQKKEVQISDKGAKRIRRFLLLFMAAAMVVCVLLIVLNTGGMLEKRFGFSIANSYFVFDDFWGDYRGGTWKLTIRMIAELPLMQKLFGVGQDCFAWYAYSSAGYSETLIYIWGNTILANAHNEWLNQWFCTGLLGGIAYLLVFLSVARTCLKASMTKKVPSFVPAVGLCVTAYMANQFFCYQQASATPIMFILMGSAVGALKQSECKM